MPIERTFFVKILLDTDELGDLPAIADEIQGILQSEGFNVIQVDTRDGQEPVVGIEGEFNV